MYEANARRVRILYGVFLGAFSVILAAVLIVEAAVLYDTGLAAGGDIYSREAVGARLLPLCGLFALWALAAVGGYLLSVLLPYAERPVRRRDDGKTVRRLKRRLPAEGNADFLAEKERLGRYDGLRLGIWAVCALFAVAAGVICIVYLAQAANFPAKDLPKEMLGLVKNAVPWIAASFVLFAAAAALEKVLSAKRLAAVKHMLALGGNAAPAPVSPAKARLQALVAGMGASKTVLVVRIVLAAVAVACIIWGICNGGAGDVLKKAINICTECIGLG